MSPELEAIANKSLRDMCQATDVNPCDLSFKATETNYNILNYKFQIHTASENYSIDIPLIVTC
jgi:hypothetical protein